MKKLIALLIMTLLYGGCSTIEYPDGFVDLIKFNSNIVDVEKWRIFSKDELIEFVDTAVAIIYSSDGYDGNHYLKVGQYYKGNLKIEMNNDVSPYIVYIEPTSYGKLVLNKNIYKSGMPIINGNDSRIRIFESEQPIILIRGNPEWADSSYKGFTILPICDSDDDGYDLNFTWTIN
ncbi:MAG: hypothetical protein LBH98_03265 [Chitinispirillales bacterium]|jgi:hypothetical protein|nr:hypothetical protein [Chitinispirillales bacterium]